jgi:hypothetical protein
MSDLLDVQQFPRNRVSNVPLARTGDTLSGMVQGNQS